MVAKRYLVDRGYFFVDKNVKLGKNEIDLIMKYKDYLVFVEVKTKINNHRGEPAELVTGVKLNQILKAAEGLLGQKRMRDLWKVDKRVKWYVDIVAVYGNGLRVDNLLHFENVTAWM